jgi:hypothetical protein
MVTHYRSLCLGTKFSKTQLYASIVRSSPVELPRSLTAVMQLVVQRLLPPPEES